MARIVEKENARIWVGKHEGKKDSENAGADWGIMLKWILNRMEGYRLHSSGSGQTPAAG